jgi:hypothetical protein
MSSGKSRLENGDKRLPVSSWVIPILTGLIVLLAVATALA